MAIYNLLFKTAFFYGRFYFWKMAATLLFHMLSWNPATILLRCGTHVSSPWNWGNACDYLEQQSMAEWRYVTFKAHTNTMHFLGDTHSWTQPVFCEEARAPHQAIHLQRNQGPQPGMEFKSTVSPNSLDIWISQLESISSSPQTNTPTDSV